MSTLRSRVNAPTAIPTTKMTVLRVRVGPNYRFKIRFFLPLVSKHRPDPQPQVKSKHRPTSDVTKIISTNRTGIEVRLSLSKQSPPGGLQGHGSGPDRRESGSSSAMVSETDRRDEGHGVYLSWKPRCQPYIVRGVKLDSTDCVPPTRPIPRIPRSQLST